MKEEDKLFREYGKKNPFCIPERYFEGFSQELMDRLPEKETNNANEVTLWQKIKPWIYMAAMFCGIMLSVRIFVGPTTKDEFPTFSKNTIENLSDEEWELIIDRSAMDDYSLYLFLTDANENN